MPSPPLCGTEAYPTEGKQARDNKTQTRRVSIYWNPNSALIRRSGATVSHSVRLLNLLCSSIACPNPHPHRVAGATLIHLIHPVNPVSSSTVLPNTCACAVAVLPHSCAHRLAHPNPKPRHRTNNQQGYHNLKEQLLSPTHLPPPPSRLLGLTFAKERLLALMFPILREGSLGGQSVSCDVDVLVLGQSFLEIGLLIVG
ncbi:MAG: hypothetical protein Q9218_007907 [Villophora microphyllina]